MSEHAVLVALDGTSLPSSVYEEHDLWTLEEQLIEILEREGGGVLDGNEVGPAETVLFLYGPDADVLFASIKPALLGNPLCQNARVTIRYGDANARSREERIPIRG
jgi:hypothetical protein